MHTVCTTVQVFAIVCTCTCNTTHLFPRVSLVSVVYFATLYVTDRPCRKKKKEPNEILILIIQDDAICSLREDFSVKSVYFNGDTNLTPCAGFEWMQSKPYGGLRARDQKEDMAKISFEKGFISCAIVLVLVSVLWIYLGCAVPRI